MRYFFNVYQTPLTFVLSFISLFLLLIIIMYIISKIFKRLQNKKVWNWILTIISVFGAGILCVITIIQLPNYMLDGQITELYILDNGQEKRLVVWFTHTEDANMIEVHSNRLKSFDLQSGKKLNRLNLNKRGYFDDYGIYGPFDRYAWGYSEQTSANLIDLFDLEIIFNKNKIREQNPDLGSDFEPIVNNFYNSEENSLTFYNSLGQYVNVLPNYSEKPNTNTIIRLQTSPAPHLEDMLNVQEILNHEKAYIITSLEIDNELLVFISIDDYTLSALRFDPKAQEILGQIDYFK